MNPGIQTIRLLILAVLVATTAARAGVERDIGPLDQRLTQPRNPVAKNFGVWDGGVEDRNNDTPQPGNTLVDTLFFRKNGFYGYNFSTEFGFKHFHSQHIVRLPNKNGHAYFMVTQSDARLVSSWPFPQKVPAGRLTLYRSDALDAVNDRVPPSTREDGTHGEVIWEEVFLDGGHFSPDGGVHPIGAWNHPCKMEMIGSLLLVSMQQWTGDFPVQYGDGTDLDAVAFYDVRDPENPKYWGRLTKEDLRVTHVSNVSMVKAGDEWIIMAGDNNQGGQYQWWRTKNVSPDIKDWTYGGTGFFSDQHGMHFNSYELYDSPDDIPPDTDFPGMERVLWFDGSADDKNNAVSGNEYIYFAQVYFGAPGVIAPSPSTTTIYRENHKFRPAPDLYPNTYGKDDYSACGLYVTGGVPIIYAPYAGDPYGPGDAIYQVWNINNVRNAKVIVTNDQDAGPGSLRRALSRAGTERITFDPSLTNTTIVLQSSLVISGDVFIDASGVPGGIAITRAESPAQENRFRIFNILSGVNVSMNNLIITGGDAVHVKFEEVSAGASHSVARASDGSLWAWGANSWGQVGNGKSRDQLSPIQIGTNHNWATIAAGHDYTVALQTNGSLWAWGNNYSGQLGDGTTTNRFQPTRIGLDNHWAKISISTATLAEDHTVALKTDGSLWAWGHNANGQIGDGSFSNRYSPVRIGLDKDWKEIASGASQTLAIKTDGSLWGWGLGTGFNSLLPTRLGVANDWAKISAGLFHTLGLKTNGSLWAWGANDYGQLGAGTPAGTPFFNAVRVGSSNDWAVIEAGGLHNIARKKDGSLWAWGYNHSGQVGTGFATAPVTTPIRIGPDQDWGAISAGGETVFFGPSDSHTMALKADGSLWTWGFNQRGQLGDATTNAKLSPARVSTGIDTGGGGGIRNQGYLSLSSCVITNNQASTFGGGIESLEGATLTLYKTTIADNSARQGGGLHAFGGGSYETGTGINRGVYVRYSTFSGNRAELDGGAIHLRGGGAFINDSTLADNVSGGQNAAGIFNGGGFETVLRNVTVVGNRSEAPTDSAGAGVLNQGVFWIQNSILADNVNGLLEPSDLSGDIRTLGANLVEDHRLGTVSGPAPITQDPMLAPLGPYGGPTETVALQPGSPAIDAAIAPYGGQDQRGFRRPFGASGDLGSYEAGSAEISVEQPPAMELVDGVSIVDFGLVEPGGSSSRTFTVRNADAVNTLTILGITLSGTSTQFSLDQPALTVLGPGQTTTFVVTFSPTDGTLQSVDLRIASNDLDESPFDITLTGSGVAPEIVIEQADLTSVVGWGRNHLGQAMAPSGLSEVAAVAAGESHSVALLKDGTVVGWGNNDHGEAQAPEGLNGVSKITAGDYFTVAIKNDGTVVAWGDNTFNQLQVPEDLTDVTEVAAGLTHVLALRKDGTVVAWGAGWGSWDQGQTMVPPGLDGVSAIAAGHSHSLALKTNGTVVAWGWNAYGQSSVPTGLNGVIAIAAGPLYSVALRNDGSLVFWGSGYNGPTPSPAELAGVTRLSARGNHMLALKTDGTVLAWGNNAFDQSAIPTLLSDVIGIAAGGDHSILLFKTPSVDFKHQSLGSISAIKNFTIKNTGALSLIINGVATTEGNSADFLIDTTGMLTSVPAGGQTTFNVTFSPTAAGPRATTLRVLNSDFDEGTFDLILTGTGVAPAPALVVEQPVGFLRNNSSVVGWGSDFYGESSGPASATDVKAIAAGFQHSLVLKNNGTLAAWGDNSHGEATIPEGLNEVIAVVAGTRHNVVLKNDGTVVAWGDNSLGQTNIPAGLSGVTMIAAGYIHTLALKNDGTVVTWPNNYLGVTNVPAGLSGVSMIAAGNAHSLALKNDGTVVAWGDNFIGQCNVPQGLNDVRAVAAGESFSVALKNDGTVVAWGNEFFGQINVPAGLNGVVAISAFTAHTAALKDDGTVVTWGGSNNGVKSPPEGLGGVTAISAGTYHTLALVGNSEVVFDDRELGTTSPPRSFTLRNEGTALLTIFGVNLSGGDVADFNLNTGGMLASIPVGGQTTFTMAFNPTEPGRRATTVRIVSNDPDRGTLDIPVAATSFVAGAPEIVIEHALGTPLVAFAGIAFGELGLGIAGVERTFTIRNVGSELLTLTNVVLVAGNSADFSVNTNETLAYLQPGQHTTFGVTFHPSAAGSRAAILRVSNSDPDEGAFDIILSGTGVPVPEIVVEQPLGSPLIGTPSSLASIIDFGVRGVGTTGPAKTFTVRNTGSGPLHIASLTLTGINPGSFSLNTTGTLFIVPVGGQTTFSIGFNSPSFPALFSASVRLISDDPDEGTFELRLFGTGAHLVTTIADSGVGSLRAAIAAANSYEAVTFASHLSGQTIVLGGTQLVINKNLTIDASTLPNGIGISGSNSSRIFAVAPGSIVTIENLTLTGGNSVGNPFSGYGGAIINQGALHLSNTTLRDNAANLRGGAIINFPGAISLALNNCTISDNSANDIGGGINNEAPLLMTNCTFSGNRALGLNGREGSGGAVFNFDLPLSIIHCTVSGNSARSLGGGLRSQFGSVTIQNSIVAGNTANGGNDIANLATAFGITGTNLIGDNSTVSTQFPAGPLVGTAANPLRPRLAQLDLYDGPIGSMPPLPGSPAVDAAIPLPGMPATDQRGASRPSDKHPDLGAVEAFALSTLPLVDTDGDGIDDRFEPAYPQLTVGVDDRALDSDGDGSPDGEELYNMTDPNNPNDNFRILSFSLTTNVVDFSLPLPLAQWVADDWAGGTANWVDRVGGRIATVASVINSPTKTSAVFPQRGAAASAGLVFDGVDDYFSVAAAQNPIVGKTSVTIAAFFLTTQGASGADGAYWRYPGPLNAESPGGPNDWALTYNAAGTAQGLFNLNITPASAVSLIDGQPHSMILTWQDPSVFPGQGMARFYVDGILVGSRQVTDGGNGIVNNGFVIGSEPETLMRYFNGAIGELRFYDSIQNVAAVHAELTGVLPKVVDVALRTFPGLGYSLESSATLSTGFQSVPASAFIATNHAETIRTVLPPGRSFIRAKRN